MSEGTECTKALQTYLHGSAFVRTTSSQMWADWIVEAEKTFAAHMAAVFASEDQYASASKLC